MIPPQYEQTESPVDNGISAEREQEVARLVDSTKRWGQSQPDVLAIALVGSWARGTPTLKSDVDFVVLTSDKQPYVSGEDWVPSATGQAGRIIRTHEWGDVTERRVGLESGLEVEYGFTDPRWAQTDPIDPGTARVATDGLVVVYDPDGLLRRLMRRRRPRDAGR